MNLFQQDTSFIFSWLPQTPLSIITLNDLPVGVVVHAGDTSIILSNPEAANILGLTHEQMSGKKSIDPEWRFVHEDSTVMKVEDYPVSKVVSTRKPLHDYVLGINRPDRNHVTWVIVNATPVFSADSELEKIVINFVDITYNKQAEAALRDTLKREQFLGDIIRNASVSVVVGYPDGGIDMTNTAFLELTGFSEEELKTIDWNTNLTPPEWREYETAKLEELHRTKSAVAYEKEYIRKDGSRVPIELVVHPQLDNEEKITSYVAFIRDITDRKRTDEQALETQKMEAIATLAGGIAHEFNNALMGVMGNIELLKMDLPEDERRDKSFEAMKDSGHRMSRLTDQLLAYARGGKYQARDLKLDDFTIETLPILQHDLNPEVRVETRFQKDISYIKADPTQIQMVLSAIMANSNEAIEDEGTIRIGAENKDIDEDFVKQHPGLKPGLYVRLTIEDDGKGMDEETKDGIFEPFFTTKFQGRGMGMAAVYGIVKSHDGAIVVDSEPGKGTVVHIYLPAVEAKEGAKAVKQPEAEIAMGEGTILVIEDEEPLVGLFREILERLGYRVLLARTGKEAVELARTFDGQIDLALLDIKLPDMDGGRVYPLIMEARPDLKVIVCSGYSLHGPAQDILDAGAEGFIQKPFLIAPFAEKLKEVLEGK